MLDKTAAVGVGREGTATAGRVTPPSRPWAPPLVRPPVGTLALARLGHAKGPSAPLGVEKAPCQPGPVGRLLRPGGGVAGRPGPTETPPCRPSEMVVVAAVIRPGRGNMRPAQAAL